MHVFSRFAIFNEINYVNVGNFYFNSIGDIIDHYRKEQIVEGYYLKEAVPLQVSVVFPSAIIKFYFKCIFRGMFLHTFMYLKSGKI